MLRTTRINVPHAHTHKQRSLHGAATATATATETATATAKAPVIDIHNIRSQYGWSRTHTRSRALACNIKRAPTWKKVDIYIRNVAWYSQLLILNNLNTSGRRHSLFFSSVHTLQKTLQLNTFLRCY